MEAPTLLSQTIKVGDYEITRHADDTVVHQMSEFGNYLDATRDDRERETENLRFITGIYDGQWPDWFDIDRERREGRHIGTYNLAYRKVAGIAGSLLRNPFDVKYIGDDPNLDNVTLSLQQAFLSDKELMDWNSEDMMAMIYGLSYRSWVWMGVETDCPASPLGNIAIRCYPAGTVIPSPDWKVTSPKKLEGLYIATYMDAEAIKDVYNKKSDEIESEIRLQKAMGESFELNEDVDWYWGSSSRQVVRSNRRGPRGDDFPQKRGDQHLVIEKNYIKNEKVTREYDPVTGMVFWEWMSDDDKKNIAQELDIPSDRIKEKKVMAKISYTRTVCPSFPNIVLEDSKNTYQVGRLHQEPFTPTWISGKAIGLIDFLKDAQREINYRQTTITTGAQGAVMAGIAVDPAAFDTDDGGYEDFKQNYGNSRQVAKLKRGASRQFPNAISNLPRVQIPQELFGIVNSMIDLMDYLVPQPAAGEARTERSGESGIHFAQKLEVMKTMQSPIMEARRQFWNNLGEMYLGFAAQVYKEGRRKFRSADGKETIINNPVIDLATGAEEVENDFSKLLSMRHKVQITESPSGVSVRLLQRELSMGMLQSWPQNMPNSQASIVENIFRSLDMTEEEKERSAEAIEKDKALINSRTDREISENMASIKMAMQAASPRGTAPEAAGAQPPQPMEGLGIPQPPEAAIANPPTDYR